MPKPTNEPDVVRQTLTLPRGVHEVIRAEAFHRRIPQQEIFRQALDLWLKREGLKSWDELAGGFEDL